jgi:glycosyltransferase involved in cell wall biosynthesis
MARTRTRVELDLRGGDPWGNFQSLLAFARELGVADRVRLLPLAAPEEMVRLSADYDVGLSLETEVVENHKICLGNKIFTYLLAGVPVLLSDTPAQSRLAGELGEAAAVVSLSDPVGIASTLDRLAGRLDAAKDRAMRLGHDRYNWNVEKKALLASVEAAFAQQRQN